MRLSEGEKKRWPQNPFTCEQSGVLAFMNGVPLLRVPINFQCPGLPSNVAEAVKLEIVATQDTEIRISSNNNSEKSLAWLGNEIQGKILPPQSNENELTPESISNLLETLYKQINAKEQKRIGSHTPLDTESARSLLCSLEKNEATASSSGSTSNPVDLDLLSCLAKITGESVSTMIPLTIEGPKDVRRRLELLLERNDLIGREVLIREEKLEQDCGNLLGFYEDDPKKVVLLQSSQKGYTVWMPGSMSNPLPLDRCGDIVGELSPRMTSINPGLRNENLSTIGLLKFAYGKPKDIGKFIVSGLLIGIAIGFLLSIGKDVGASRWIFALGITGTFLGGCLGYLSGGFRSGVAAMAVATGLAMLTPTFNTVITNQALPDRDLGLLLQISLVLLAALVTRVGLEWIQDRDVLLTQHKGAAQTQLAGFHRLMSLPTEYFRTKSVGELQLSFRGFEDLRLEIQTLLEGGFVKFLLTSAYILFMLRISVKLTLLSIIVAILIIMPTILMALQSRPLQRHQQIARAEAESRNLELINSVSKLRLAGAEAPAAKWWAERYQQVVNLENSLDAKEATANLLKKIMPNTGKLMIYIMMTKLITEAATAASGDAPNIGQQLGFFSAFETYIGGVAGIAGLLAGAFDLPVIYERTRPILDSERETQDDNEEIGELTGDIELDRVSYRYENDSPLVLDNVSFKAKSGEYVAIVGPSGCGKSTLVRMLLGFDMPEDGTVRYDGRPLEGMDLKSVRRQIGTVLQTNSLFSGSLMESIAGGAVIQEEDAWNAAELAGLSEDIKDMPMGMQTIIPDGGGTLSGGQRQRVAIARALVRKPRLLIFDEATSALDNKSQAVVSRSLDQLSITRIVIAHRLSTIRNADRIVVMEKGQVQEQGDYDTLMDNQGLFSRLMQRQIQ